MNGHLLCREFQKLIKIGRAQTCREEKSMSCESGYRPDDRDMNLVAGSTFELIATCQIWLYKTWEKWKQFLLKKILDKLTINLDLMKNLRLFHD